MELSQYKETFLKEQISGDILLQCDNQILEVELKISSRLHRLRLMQVIDGKASVQQLLHDSRYVIFTKKE